MEAAQIVEWRGVGSHVTVIHGGQEGFDVGILAG